LGRFGREDLFTRVGMGSVTAMSGGGEESGREVPEAKSFPNEKKTFAVVKTVLAVRGLLVWGTLAGGVWVAFRA
jgi:hypothetical protein